MKHLKKFNSQDILKNYSDDNWVSPHIYLDGSNKSLDYEEKYTPVEYISSTQTGGQYIDLGCKLFENTDQIEIEFKFNFRGTGKDNNNQAVIIGSNDESNSNYPGMLLRKNNEQAQFKIKNANFSYYINDIYQGYGTHNNGNYTAAYSMEKNNIYKFKAITADWNNNSTHNKNITLFCGLNSSNNPFRFAEADLYYLRLYKGGVIVRDLIPVLTKNGIPGLYDKAHKVFYKSQGDEEFVAGPKI